MRLEMSTRQRFEAAFGVKSEYDKALLDKVLSEHAHELAEKIRATMAHLKDAGPTAHSVWAINEQAADLIDPEVT